MPIDKQGSCEFIAEVGNLSGCPSLVDARAKSDVESLVVGLEHLRRLMIVEAEPSERIIRALILRRLAPIEKGADGPVLIGEDTSSDTVKLQEFLACNGDPLQPLVPSSDPEAKTLPERYAPGLFGGQAGASARIELSRISRGISGQALAGRALVQAQKFGAEISVPSDIGRPRLLRSSPLARSVGWPNGSRAPSSSLRPERATDDWISPISQPSNGT